MVNIKNQRRKFSSEFKSKVALEALSNEQSINELAEKFDLNPTQIADWKKTLITKAHLAFQPDETPTDQVTRIRSIQS